MELGLSCGLDVKFGGLIVNYKRWVAVALENGPGARRRRREEGKRGRKK